MTPAYLASSFPINLKIWRELRGDSQRRLAKLIGTHESVICHYENGDRLPSVENLLKLCEALECSPNELLTNRDSRLIQISKDEHEYLCDKASAFDKIDLIVDAVISKRINT